MNSRVLNPFLEATIETCRILCHVPAKPLPPFIKGKVHQQDCEIMAVTSLTSPTLAGVICVRFPNKVFLRLIGGMMTDIYPKVPERFKDGAGEILSVLTGYARTLLEREGYNVEYSIPAVCMEGEMQVPHYTPPRTIVTPFETVDGIFYLELGLTENSLAGAKAPAKASG